MSLWHWLDCKHSSSLLPCYADLPSCICNTLQPHLVVLLIINLHINYFSVPNISTIFFLRCSITIFFQLNLFLSSVSTYCTGLKQRPNKIWSFCPHQENILALHYKMGLLRLSRYLWFANGKQLKDSKVWQEESHSA